MKSELGETSSFFFDEYRQAKYKIAIEHVDIAVKPPLVTWLVSQVQSLHMWNKVKQLAIVPEQQVACLVCQVE